MAERLDHSTLGPRATVGLVVASAATVSALVTLLIEPQVMGQMGMGPGMGLNREPGAFTDLRLFISTYNVLVLLALTWTYLVVYRDIPNPFTVSLLLFSVALLLYALASNPAVHVLFGFRGGPGLGPFAFLPDLFAAIAVTVLLYQSYQ